jgi:hypothetical protein
VPVVARAQAGDPVRATPVFELIPLDASGSWAPPEPESVEKRRKEKRPKDWIQLKSGELLRGEIEYIHEDELHLDSDELDDLDIDWDDVVGLRSPVVNTYRFGDRTVVSGTAAMRGAVIRVRTHTDAVLEFPRSELESMIEGKPEELNYWSLNLGLGGTLRSGNTDQTDLSVNGQLERETPLTNAILIYESANSVVEDEEVTDNQRLGGLFAYYVTRRTSIVAPIGEIYRDRIRNLDLRGTVGAGVGYDVIDRPRAEWNVIAAAGYQRTEFAEVELGDDDQANDAALIFRTTLELDPVRDVDWDTNYEAQLVVTDFDKTSQHLSSVLSFEFWGPLDLDVRFDWDRIQEPSAEEDGSVPESDDFQLTIGISLDL